MNVRNRMIDNMLATGKPFTISLVFVGIASVENLKGSLPSKIIRLCWKSLAGTNTLAYYEH